MQPRNRVKRRTLLLMKQPMIAGLLVFSLVSVANAQPAPSAQRCSERGQISVHFEAVFIRPALAEFAEKAGVSVAFPPRLRGFVTVVAQCEYPAVILEQMLSQIGATYCLDDTAIVIVPEGTRCSRTKRDPIFEFLQ